MHRPGHYGVTLACYAPIGTVALAVDFETLAIAGGVIAVGGAMVPDLDQRVPGLTHRGITHTVWFALVLSIVLGIGGVVAGGIAAGVIGALAGAVLVIAHLLADMLTPMGVRPFAPVRDRRYTLDLVRASSTVGNYLLLIVGVVIAAATLYAGRLVVSVV
jgi:inner membrane protein